MRKLWHLIAAVVLLCTLLVSGTLAEGKNHAIFYEDGVYAEGLAAFAGDLYILNNEGLYVYDEEAQTQTLVTDRVNSDYRAALSYSEVFADESGLYGYISEPSSIVRILDENGTLDMETTFELKGSKYAREVFMQEGTIYRAEASEAGFTLLGTKLADQSESTIVIKTADSLEGLYAYKDNQAVIVLGSRSPLGYVRTLCFLDLTSAEMVEQPVEISLRPTIYYDAESDSLYWAIRPGIYRLKEGAEAELCAYPLGGDMGSIVAFGTDMLAMTADGNIGIYNTRNTAQQTALVVQHPYARSVDYSDYITEHPEISLRFSGDLSVTAEEEFVSEMTTQSSDIDVFLLSDLNMLTTIHEKAYGVDLAANDEINALVEDMYAPFKQALKRDGKIYAIPQNLYIMMLGYTPEFFETFELDVPTTYDGMLDLAKLWMEEYAGDSPEGYFDLFTCRFELITMLKRYGDERLANGQELIFDTPEMAALVQKYLDVSKLYENYEYPTGDSIYAFNVIDIPHRQQIYGYAPLCVDPKNEYVISAADIEFEYFLINPYSEHKEEAIEFLETYMKSWENWMSFLLLQSKAYPMETSAYASEKEAALQTLAEQKDRLESSAVENQAEIRAEIQNVETFLADVEQNRWLFTEVDIQWYQEAVSHIVLSKINPLSILEKSDTKLFEQLAEGSIEPARFLKQLDEKIQSIYLEAQ